MTLVEGMPFLFSSESVSEGHPDKLCDRISDAILDACLAQDKNSLVACETCATNDFIMVFGEICTLAHVDYESIVRRVICSIGYDDPAKGLDYKTVNVSIKLSEQSREIRAGLHIDQPAGDIGAGDQGIMFGYATDETEELMPISHVLATLLTQRITHARKSGIIPWLWPDGKSQVTVEYFDSPNGGLAAKRIHTVLVSQQHSPQIPIETVRDELKKFVLSHILPTQLVDEKTIIHINPCGPFTLGGPAADSGLTGRKIICDTYGGWGAHGGGAFSGKDSTKVDRSAAYAARQIAKTLVANKLCRRVLVQVAYSIGLAAPLSLYVNSYGSAIHPWNDQTLCSLVQHRFDLRPGIIRERLQLQLPIFEETATHGHFGRSDIKFPWERIIDLHSSTLYSQQSAQSTIDPHNTNQHQVNQRQLNETIVHHEHLLIDCAHSQAEAISIFQSQIESIPSRCSLLDVID